MSDSPTTYRVVWTRTTVGKRYSSGGRRVCGFRKKCDSNGKRLSRTKHIQHKLIFDPCLLFYYVVIFVELFLFSPFLSFVMMTQMMISSLSCLTTGQNIWSWWIFVFKCCCCSYQSKVTWAQLCWLCEKAWTHECVAIKLLFCSSYKPLG